MDSTIPTNEAAEKAVAFVNALTHVKGPNAREPFNLRDWQEPIVRRLFGTLDEHGRRQYRTAGIFLPRKNGKTELAAALALRCLIGEQEQGGEVYSAAVDRHQASLIFNICAGMVRNDPELSQLCRIVESTKRITFHPTRSEFRSLSADADHNHGLNASCVVADEVHAWPNDKLWNVLKTSSGARTQPLFISISTVGCNKDSLCYRLWDYASKVRDGIVEDPTFLPVIFAADEADDWTSEATWHKANPALGDFRNLDEMRQSFHEARVMPAQENTFKQLYLNLWVESVSRWITSEAWDACGQALRPLYGRDCFGALDLAYRNDFAAWSAIFPDDDGSYDLHVHFWIPEEGGHRDLSAYPLRRWIEDGLITVTPGNSTDFGTIRQYVCEFSQERHVKKVAVDPWNARQLASELIADGIEVEEFAQTLKNFNEPTKAFESLVLAGKLRHAGNPVLRWMIANVAIEQDASGNYRPSKKKSTEKIDGAVSSIMALALASKEPEDDQPQLIILGGPRWS